MREYRYEKLDAFTSGASTGNPAACIYLEDGHSVSVEQGGSDREFNIVCLTTVEGKVLFGGRATTRIAGSYYL